MRTIFVIDDEENIRFLIGEYLLREGYIVETFASIEELIQRLEVNYPDMLILDIMLPGQDGLDFCRDLRRKSGVPVIFISARGEEIDKVIGLELGGDDYLTKPFSPRELVARVRSIFRRTANISVSETPQSIGNISIFPADRRVVVDRKEVQLTPKEYELLLLLIQQPQRTFNRQELLDRVWGCDYVGGDRAVDDLVKRLRKKMRDNGASNNVKTIWGYGYKFDVKI